VILVYKRDGPTSFNFLLVIRSAFVIGRFRADSEANQTAWVDDNRRKTVLAGGGFKYRAIAALTGDPSRFT
jgi:hypothetical protein